MPARLPAGVGVFDFLALHPTGPIIVSLTTPTPETLPEDTLTALTDELERIAPGRVTLVLLEDGATLADLDDDTLTTIGLARVNP